MIARLLIGLLLWAAATLAPANPVLPITAEPAQYVAAETYSTPIDKALAWRAEREHAPPLLAQAEFPSFSVSRANGCSDVFGKEQASYDQCRSPIKRLTSLLSDGATVADYDASLGVTGTLNASAWANQIGAAGPLLQATGANQPIVLPYVGEKYAWFPQVTANRMTTANAAVNRITGDIAAIIKIAPNAWDDAVNQQVAIGKWVTDGNQRAYFVDITGAGGAPRLFWSTLGSDTVFVTATAASPFSAGQTGYLGFSLDVDNGSGGYDVKFFTSTDGVTFTQLGTTVTGGAPTSIFASSAIVQSGANDAGASGTFLGRIYRAQIYNGIPPILGGAGSASPAVDFNAADWSETSTNGATQASSTTGETWTLNNTGALPAQIVGSASLLFDGADDYLAATFTLNQPETIYFVGKQVTWTDADRIFDGNGANTGSLYQRTVTPSVELYAGTEAAINTNLVLNTNSVATAIFNGAASSIQIDSNAATTGNPGANNMGGFTLGALAAVSNFGNIQVKRVIIRAAADSAATQAQIQALLKAIYGTP